MNEEVSIIIPSYNSFLLLPECLESIYNSDFSGIGIPEVIVVSDGHCDLTKKAASRFACRFIELDKRRGAAYARNTGVKEAQGNILIFTDADIVFAKDTLKELVTAIKADVSVAVGMNEYRIMQDTFFSDFKNLSIYYYQYNSLSSQICWFWGACGAIKKNVFINVGGFDESFKSATVEDMELGYRLTKGSYRISVVKEAQVTHKHRYNLISILINDFKKSRDWSLVKLRYSLWHTAEGDNNLSAFSRGYSVVGAYVLFFALVYSAFFGVVLLKTAIIGCFLLLMNERKFYKFIYKKRPVFFLLKAILFQIIDYIVIGVGIFYGVLNYFVRRKNVYFKNKFN